MKVLLFLVALAALVVLEALAQTPPVPVWPRAFSSSVLIRRDRERRPEFFRWFYDFGLKLDRFDGVRRWQGEDWFAEMVLDHVSNTQYNIFYQLDTVVCFTHAINWTMDRPSFTGASFIGKGLVDYQPVYHWYEEDKTRGIHYQIWDAQSDVRELVRIDIDDTVRHRAESWTFMEFDARSQNPNMFNIPDDIAAQCSPVPEGVDAPQLFH